MKSVLIAVMTAIMTLSSLGTGQAKAAAAGALATKPVQTERNLIVNVQRRGGARRGARRARAAGRRSVRRSRSARRSVRRGRAVRRSRARRRTIRRSPRRIVRRSVRRGRVARRGRARRYVAPRRRGRRGRRIVRYGLYAAPALSYYYYDVYPRRCAWIYRKWRRTGSRYWRRRFISCMDRYYW